MDWTTTFELTASFAESLGGLKKQLVNQGISEETAEKIIIEVVRNQGRRD